MSDLQLIPALALITLGIVLAVAVTQLIAFRSKRRNREADRHVDMGRRPIADNGRGFAAGATTSSSGGTRDPIR